MMRLADQELEHTPFCVIDLETTGLSPGFDRVVEITAIRMNPGEEPHLVFDTLVHPERRVAGTEIHGITDDDVVGAPTFAELVPEVLGALSGAVLASYNVYFDLRFLVSELERNGMVLDHPYLCAMYMRPLLGLGKRCTLSVACEEHGLDHVGMHSSAGDAIATAELMRHYLEVARGRGARTFAEIARKKYKFLRSWSSELVGYPSAPIEVTKKSRSLDSPAAAPVPEQRRTWRLREYQEAVIALLEDYEVSREELEYARDLRSDLGIADDEVRAVHARVFAATLNQWAADERIDEAEVEGLAKLSAGLAALGWSPGARMG